VAYVLDVDIADNLWYFSTYPQLDTLLMEEANDCGRSNMADETW